MNLSVVRPKIDTYAEVVERRPFTVATNSGELGGWLSGAGARVLAIHGGPGMSFDYLDDAVAELARGYEVATYQQRGLPPSTLQGEFTVAEAVADIEAVLDGLGWNTAYVMGHSWGGHLAFHAAVSIPARLAGVLAVDPLGATGDGESEAFGAAKLARLTETARKRVQVLDDKAARGETRPEDAWQEFKLFWPTYFANPASAPPTPPVRLCPPASQTLWDDLTSRLPELEASLPSIRIPFGVLVGGKSPMPVAAGIESARRIPNAWCHVEPEAGHFPWHESPGCLRAAMDRLVQTA